MPQTDNFKTLIKTFQEKLLEWYKENNRGFPWRCINDKYGIIIAEILLQKTNSEKVEKVYNLFLKKFPNFEVLFNAPDSTIKEALKYLGLQNQKVPILKGLAEKVLKDYKGDIPSNKEDLLSIKGIGEYISNAVLCFAFNKRVSIIDGNTIRILERLFNIKSSKKNPRNDKIIWQKMEGILPFENYRDFNYACLDFASLICRFYTPNCEDCFMNHICYYYKTAAQKVN